MWFFSSGRTSTVTETSCDVTDFATIINSDQSPFRCIKCDSAAITEDKDEYRCDTCNAVYPVVFGVPLLVDHFSIGNSEYWLTDETAAKICSQMGIVSNSENYQELRSILGKNYQIGSLAQSAENNYFLNRVVVSETEKRPSINSLAKSTAVNVDVRYSIDLHYVPPVLRSGQDTSYNVRFTNTGDSVISSKVENPVRLSYQFVGSGGSVTEGRRTVLPIEVLPGRSLTVPLAIRTPAKPGQYELKIVFVKENEAWLSQDAVSLTVEVTNKRLQQPCSNWTVTKVNHGGYGPDHQAGKAMLVNLIKKQNRPRVLEIGGCCNPMMRGVCEDLHSIDIDMQTLQIGHMIAEQAGQKVRYICADGSNLPYRENSFDWIVMFSTLHHFSDPAQVLGNLKRFLKPNGRIATMCEPIGHYIDGVVYDAFIEELEQGINEQTFTLEEYQTMIDNAGLKVDKAIVDVGSLKLILKA